MKKLIAFSLLAVPVALSTVAPPSAYALTMTNPSDATSNPDYAAQASISASTTGPSDSQFSSQESAYNTPLYGYQSWHGFLRQSGRNIDISLPQDQTVHTFSIEMEQNASSGVFYPTHVDFEVNQNGQWYKVGSAYTKVPTTDKRLTTQTFSIKTTGVTGHLFRITFPVSVWAFARHVHLYGGTPGDGGQAPAMSLDNTSYQQPLSPWDQRSHGIRNMLLVYSGDYGDRGTWTSTDFQPMVSYVPQNGTPQSTLFDTMLFGPYGSLADTQTAWQAYIDNLFATGQQLSALDAAVAQNNQTTGNTGYKEKVVLTVPYPAFGDGAWGSGYSFNGSSSDPAALQAREQAVQWYMQTMLSRWQSAGFQNLQLTGFYWNNEQVSYDKPGEVALVKNTVAQVHAKGYPLFWIPFYGASGVSDWQSLGFDAVWLQPNFIEQGTTADPTRIRNAEDYARRHGMGVELELTDQALWDSQYEGLYSTTLNQLAQDGFAGNVSHAYYAGSKLLVTAAASTQPYTRIVYDNTYNFIAHP